MKSISRRTVLLASSTGLLSSCAHTGRRGRRAESASSKVSDDEEREHARHSEPDASPPESEWIHSWVSAQQLVEPENHPPAVLTNGTLRQRLLLTLGGSGLRIRVSNEFGKSPLEVTLAHVALPEKGAKIDQQSGRAISFDGQPHVTIAPGEVKVSDPIDFPLPAQTELAVTLCFLEVPSDLTGHPGSRTTSYLKEGAPADDATLSGAHTTDHWYFLSGVEVLTHAQARAVIILGDSITDGRGSTTNHNDRWPNVFARRLLGNDATAHLAVLNQGIGGNRVLANGLGPPLLDRYHRDAIEIEKARFLLILAGINDLGALHGGKETPPPSAARLIEAFQEIAQAAHKKEQRVYGATLLPYEGSFYFTQEGEVERQKLNEWMRTTKALDACIDFDKLARDPNSPTRLRPEVDGGDHLHPSKNGHNLMGHGVDLELF